MRRLPTVTLGNYGTLQSYPDVVIQMNCLLFVFKMCVDQVRSGVWRCKMDMFHSGQNLTVSLLFIMAVATLMWILFAQVWCEKMMCASTVWMELQPYSFPCAG